MSKSWLLDVLADLKSFAAQNDLPIVAAQLDDLVVVAMAEIATQSDACDCDSGRSHYGRQIGNVFGRIGPGKKPG